MVHKVTERATSRVGWKPTPEGKPPIPKLSQVNHDFLRYLKEIGISTQQAEIIIYYIYIRQDHGGQQEYHFKGWLPR